MQKSSKHLILLKKKGVLAVYIFGSVATGKQNKNSNIDICVIPEDMYDSLDIVVDASSKLPKKFDIKKLKEAYEGKKIPS